MRQHRHHAQQGFALITIGALFVGFALISAVMIDRANATKQLGMNQRTQAQMSRLSDALIRYALGHSNRYPCPASITLAVTDAAFGQPVTGCESGASYASGLVPITELLMYGATPGDAFDAWGNRIVYMVDRQMTPSGTGSASGTRPVITDTTTGTTITYRDPDYIFISYGRDGVGAIPKNRTSVAVACVANGELRMDNCNGDLNFTTRPITTGAGVTSTQYFDDILVFFGR